MRGKKRAGGAEESSPEQAQRRPGLMERRPAALEGRQMNMALFKRHSGQSFFSPAVSRLVREGMAKKGDCHQFLGMHPEAEI
jgi:hypothetical protein